VRPFLKAELCSGNANEWTAPHTGHLAKKSNYDHRAKVPTQRRTTSMSTHGRWTTLGLAGVLALISVFHSLLPSAAADQERCSGPCGKPQMWKTTVVELEAMDRRRRIGAGTAQIQANPKPQRSAQSMFPVANASPNRWASSDPVPEPCPGGN